MGQTLISALLIVVVTISVINANRLVINSETARMEGLARMQSLDIAMEMLTEIRLKKFDEYADTLYYQETSVFTSPYSLGRETGESISMPDTLPFRSSSRFDDIDDYTGYVRTANTRDIRGYRVDVTVFYATPTSPDILVTSRQYVKTVRVQVSHPTYQPTPIRMFMTKTY